MKHAVSTSSFHLPLRFLTPAKRSAMHVIYNFCRQADDAVDEAVNNAEAAQHLIILRERIHSIYAGSAPSDPLCHVVQHFNLKRDYFDAMLDGMEMDLTGQMLKPVLSTLTLYCYRVAGCVGLLSIAVFGNDEPQAEIFAIALGHALQLTNILRDLREDATRGRIYLPLEWLKEEGISGVSAAALDERPGPLEQVCRRLAQHALHYFAEADNVSRSCNKRRLLPALLMRDVYLSYLRMMVARSDFLKPHRVHLHFHEKLCIAVKAVRYLL